MTDPISLPLQPNARFKRHLAATAMPASERRAIHAGVRAGDAALARSGSTGVLTLFTEVWQSQTAAPTLQALRAYAELRRVVAPMGHEVPAISLIAAGFTAAEITAIDTMIAAIPPETALASDTRGRAAQKEAGR